MSRRSPAPLLGAIAVAALVLALVTVAAASPAAAASSPPPPPPRVRAPAAIVVQPDTGDVVLARSADQERPIASTTKLMTALLTIERLPLSRVVTAAPYHPGPAESLIGLRPGERMRVRDLLRGLFLASGNDAAVTLATAVSGSTARFVTAMNARARKLGLRHTHFANPVGLDAPGNFSSARDLAMLAETLLRIPFVATTVDRPAATLTSGARVRHILNRNLLVREVPWVDGVKTGHTSQAGYVLVGAARRNGVRLISVVLGDPSEAARDADSLALLRWGLGRYARRVALRRGRLLGQAALKYRNGEHVVLVAARDLALVARRGQHARVQVNGTPSELEGPLASGTREGTAIVRVGGRVRGRVAIVTAAAVPRATLTQRATTFFTRPLTLVLVVLLIACSLQLALLRHRASRRRRPGSEHGRRTNAA